jgi:hypothetical protein
MVVLRCETGCEVAEKLNAISSYRLKNKNVTAGGAEWVVEMELTDKALVQIEKLCEESGIREVTVMNSVSGSVL